MGQARSEVGRGRLLLLVSRQHAGNCFHVLGLEVGSDAVVGLAVNDRMDMLQRQKHWGAQNPLNPSELGFVLHFRE